MSRDTAEVEHIVGAVRDPELDLPLSETGMVRGVHSKRRRVSVDLALPVGDWPGEDELRQRLGSALAAVQPSDDVVVDVALMDEGERAALRAHLREKMAEPVMASRVIGVCSGKGGVGKSSVTVNLAVALARAGSSVGVLDADVYGFSVPRMLGVDRDPVVLGDMVLPVRRHGVRTLSMGFFVPDDQPVIWRGPMLHKAIQQFLEDAYWGAPEFLLVDMPPGTGDVTLSLAQVMSRSEVVVVTTPQPAAQRVAQRSAYAARKLKLPVRGVIENLSWFTGDDGTRYELFGRGGGEALAQDLGVPLLGQLPLVVAVREGGDSGEPITVSAPDSEAGRAFGALAERLAALGPARVYREELKLR